MSGHLPGSALVGLRCAACTCGGVNDDMRRDPTCPTTGLAQAAVYDLDALRGTLDRDRLATGPRSMWRWRSLLPVRDEANVASLLEGDTPLRRATRVGEDLGLPRLWIKDETVNPSGSFKDRGASVTASKCVEVGIEGLVLASSGNSVTSLSTYCARAGLRMIGLLRDQTSAGQLLQTLVFGTRAVVVDGDMVDGSRLAQEIADALGLFHAALPNNLYRVEGKKTLAYEICEGLGWRVPDRILVPTAGATNVLALHKGFRELNALGWIDAMPAIDVVQTSGCAPIVRALERGEPVRRWTPATTRVTGLAHPLPGAGDAAVAIVRETGGRGWTIDDDEAFDAARYLARREGLFVQPASAAGLAVLRRLDAGERRRVFGDGPVVLIATGSGKNQIEAALEAFPTPPRIPPTLEAFRAALRGSAALGESPVDGGRE